MRNSLIALLLLALPSCTMVAPNRPAYLVFFDKHAATLDAASLQTIARAAETARAMPDSRVLVLGYTDSAGSPAADISLSQLRAQTVADALRADGVAASRITRMGRGQTHEDPGVASRRVEIDIGG